MKQFKYNTGRIYDFEQVLDCEIVRDDDSGKQINVKDLSRHMFFTVRLHDNRQLSDRELGEIILDKYDQGMYDHWSRSIDYDDISINQ